MRKATIALGMAAGLCVAAGGGYLWALQAGQAGLRDAAAAVRAGLGPAGSLSYAASAVHPFSRSATLTDVAMRLPSGPLLTAATLVLVQGSGGRDGGRLARVHAERLRLEAPGGSVATADTLDGRDIVLPPPVAGQPYRLAPDAVFFSALALDGIALQAPGGSAQLATLAVADYGPGRRSTLTASGLVVPLARLPGVDRVGFASLSTSGLGLADLAGALSRGDVPPRANDRSGRAELDGLYAAAGSARPVTIARILGETTPGPAGASAMTGAVEGMDIEPLTDAAKAGMAAIGLPSVRGSLSWSASYDAAGGRLTVAPFRMSIEKVGTLTIGTLLSRIDLSAMQGGQPDPLAVMAAGERVVLGYVDATLADDGLLDMMLALGSRRTGLPAAQLRTMLANQITQAPALAAFLGSAASREALAAFVTGGGTLDVAARPPAPVTLGEVAQAAQLDPTGVAGRLGLVVTRTAASGPAR